MKSLYLFSLHTKSILVACLYDYVSACSYTIHNYVFCQCYLIKKKNFTTLNMYKIDMANFILYNLYILQYNYILYNKMYYIIIYCNL